MVQMVLNKCAWVDLATGGGGRWQELLYLCAFVHHIDDAYIKDETVVILQLLVQPLAIFRFWECKTCRSYNWWSSRRKDLFQVHIHPQIRASSDSKYPDGIYRHCSWYDLERGFDYALPFVEKISSLDIEPVRDSLSVQVDMNHKVFSHDVIVLKRLRSVEAQGLKLNIFWMF